MLLEVRKEGAGLVDDNRVESFSESTSAQPMFEIEEVSEVLDKVFGILCLTSFQVSPYQNIVVHFFKGE